MNHNHMPMPERQEQDPRLLSYKRLEPHELTLVSPVIPAEGEGLPTVHIFIGKRLIRNKDVQTYSHFRLLDVRSAVPDEHGFLNIGGDSGMELLLPLQPDDAYLLVQDGARSNSGEGKGNRFVALKRGHEFEFGRPEPKKEPSQHPSGAMLTLTKLDKSEQFEVSSDTSRHHFRIVIDEDGDVILEDLDSTNGTHYAV